VATLKEYVRAVKIPINRGAASNDSQLTDKFIAFHLKQARAQLIQQKLEREEYVSDLNYITICVPLEEHTYHDCSCIPDIFDCKINRSTCEIPQDLVARTSSSVQVKLPDGKMIDKGTITSNNLAEYSLTNRDPKAAWLIENKKLVILNKPKLKVALMKGIWADPDKLATFCTCMGEEMTDTPCYDPMNDNFPIDAELGRMMIRMAEESIIRYLSAPNDKENNSRQNEVVQDIE